MAVTAPAPGNPLQEFYSRPGVPLSSGPDRARRQARMLADEIRVLDIREQVLAPGTLHVFDAHPEFSP